LFWGLHFDLPIHFSDFIETNLNHNTCYQLFMYVQSGAAQPFSSFSASSNPSSVQRSEKIGTSVSTLLESTYMENPHI
jgi:hypothetical protein